MFQTLLGVLAGTPKLVPTPYKGINLTPPTASAAQTKGACFITFAKRYTEFYSLRMYTHKVPHDSPGDTSVPGTITRPGTMPGRCLEIRSEIVIDGGYSFYYRHGTVNVSWLNRPSTC